MPIRAPASTHENCGSGMGVRFGGIPGLCVPMASETGGSVWRLVLLIPLVWRYLLAYGALIISNSAILSWDGQGSAGAQPLGVTSVRISGLAVHTLVCS